MAFDLVFGEYFGEFTYSIHNRELTTDFMIYPGGYGYKFYFKWEKRSGSSVITEFSVLKPESYM